MELLDHGLLAAAMTDFFSPLEGDCDGLDGGGATHNSHMDDDDSSFDLSDFFLVNDNALPTVPPELSAAPPTSIASSFERNLAPPTMVENHTRDELPPLPRMEEGSRIAFRIKTDEEILDDGFKWRKYGKKSVKNRPNNPRNYYRCSTEGCSVKKRVERDHEDPSYVITTYEGIHNHSSPGVIYYATQDSVSGRFLFSGSQVHGPGSSATASSTSSLT